MRESSSSFSSSPRSCRGVNWITTWCMMMTLVAGWQSKYISSNFYNSSAGQYYQHSNDHKVTFTGFGVFLLGTLRHAVDLGETLETGHGSEAKYYDRLVAARATWARHAKVFYAVTGRGGPQDRVLNNASACSNETLMFRKMLHNHHAKPRSFEVHRCGEPELGMHVLHLPRCEDTYAGAEGPCCRCEGAMLYFLALNRHHKAANDLSSRGAFPDWFLFVDDDYYVRLNYLHAIVNKPLTPASGVYALLSESGFDKYKTKVKGTEVITERQGYGLFQKESGKCTARCVHRMNWMGFGAYSLGALLKVEAHLIDEGLVKTCHRWGVTHDIGWGIYTWMFQIPVVDLPLGGYSERPKPDGEGYTEESVHWHRPGYTADLHYDELFEMIWTKGKGQGKVRPGDAGSGVSGASVESGSATRPFDLEQYLDQEREYGVKFPTKVFPNGYASNTMLSRRVAYAQALSAQVQETQHTPALRAALTDYAPSDCHEDHKLFTAWERSQREWSSLPKDEGTYPRDEKYLKECLLYGQYVANLPLTMAAKDLPPLDGLLRGRKRE